MPAENATMVNGDSNEESPQDEGESLIIPIQSSSNNDLFMEIFPEELKEIPSSTLLQVLQDEKASQETWANAGLAYMKQNLAGESSAILQAACSNASSKNGSSNPNVRLLASAGIAHLAVGNSEEDRRRAEERFTAASKEDTFFPMNWMGQGFLNFRANRLDQARFFFDTTLKQCGPVLPALLGMAAVVFCEGNYQQAQDLYGQAMKLYPSSNSTTCASMRVGFGLACYRLGQVDRAKAAFRRALELDPECVSAMVATAILSMSNIEQMGHKRERAMKLMSMAHLLDHSNAMVQNHLANHYFWKWTPLPGHVSVTKGSSVFKTSQPIPLDVGERIRIGMTLETIVQEEETENGADSENSFLMKDVWTKDSNDSLKLWKKDYDRVSALAKGAYSSTTVEAMQAESLFLLARVHHVREELENANKLYEKACKLAPDLTPARFGLAQTLLAQEDYKGSMQHLKLVVKKSATAADALALLGLLEVKAGGQAHTKEGLLHLRKAIDLDPLNPDLIVMEALALQQEKTSYPKSLERYQKAVELFEATNKVVPYELFCNIGVLCHETKMYDRALQYFSQALRVLHNQTKDKENDKPSKSKDGASRICQAANHMFWEFHLVKQVQVPPQEGSKTLQVGAEGLKSLKKGDFVRVGDSFISEILDMKEDTIELKDFFIPPPLEIAKANENQVIGDKEKGDEDTKENVQEGSGESKDSKLINFYVKRENNRLDNQQAITIAFNIARVHENNGNMLAAVELHKAIIKRVPAYVNCYLRLACIARDSGCLKECSAWLKLACTIAPGNPEVLTLVGNLHLSLCDWGPAQNVFDQLLLKRVSKVEAYSKLSMGNIFFANLDNPKTYDKNLRKAVDLYKSILAKDKANAYAANGIGTYFAEKGELFKAKEVFNRVREVSGDTIADALLNLGHIYLAQKKHAEALQMYQSYMKRTQDGTAPITTKSRADDEAEVLLYIAFAYFDWARQMELFNNAQAAPADERYQKAIQHLELALQKSKRREVVLQYNLCMTKLQAANCVLQKLTRNIRRTAKEVEDALNGLEESLPKVQEMLEWKSEGKKVLIPTSMLQDFITHCNANIDSAKSHLEEEKKREEQAKEYRDLQNSAAEAKKQELELREVMKKEEAIKQQEERDRRAAAKMRAVEDLRVGWVQEAEQTRKTKEKKERGNKERHAEDELVEEEDPTRNLFEDESSDEEEEAAAKTQENEKDTTQGKENNSPANADTTEKDLFGDSSEESDSDSDEDLLPTEKKRTANDDGEEEEKNKQPAKRQRVIDSDDDE
mmetsp:Transcript_24049/g.35571  ORF Transcript_24049/g.35571 Transcript_24049/m.35571 type:complete len:1284 (+) Transcript_24049:89-3940(+)